MDKLQWFKFSYADWRMGKIQRCPQVTQARFINLCCLYWSKEANLTVEDAEIEIDKEHLDILISKKIIEANEEHIFINFLDEQLQDITETSKGKSKAAKARWDKYRKDKGLKQDNADVMQVHKDAMQNSAEKRREEERREEETIEDERHFSINVIADEYKCNDRIIKAVLNNGLKLASNKEDLLSKVDDFVLHLETTGETTKQKKDFNSHFLNWIKIQKKHEPLDTTNETLQERAARLMREEMNR
jgi:hypothetical protein